MGQLNEDSITNDSIRKKLYHMHTVKNQISICLLTFVGVWGVDVETLTSEPRFSPLGVITRKNIADFSQEINGLW